MPWFKKSKKSHQPAALDAPAHIAAAADPLGFGTVPDLDVSLEGVNSGMSPQIALPDRRIGDRQLHVLGTSTRTTNHGSGAETLQEQGRDRGVPLDTPNEQLSQNGLDHPDIRRSEGWNRGKHEDQGTVSGRPSGMAPGLTYGDDQLGKDARYAVRHGWSSDPERTWGDTALGAVAVPIDVLEEDAEGFRPLKTALEAVSTACTDHKEAVAVGNKIENLLSRVSALETLFATRPGDVEEQRRRNELIRKLEGIEGQLQSLYERPGPREPDGHAQSGEDVFELLEDLRETISHYQTAQQKEIYERKCEQIDAAEATILNNFRCAQAAEHRHGDREGCLKGTRRAVLDEVELWTRDLDKPPVYWLNGLAGTGKSTIAQTVAESAFADGQLGASFFCSRDFEDRSNLRFIFPTLAVQLARRYTKFRSTFIPLARSDPGIAHESLYNQMNKLIVGPFKKSSISTVIVIDALDECKDEEPASAILSVLGQFVSQIPTVKFFVTGRPEPRIRAGFHLPLLAKATDVFVLHEVESSRVNSDIKLFFRHKFLGIKARWQGLGDWPTKEQLDLLCERAAGLFVYAMATIKFIEKQNINPRKRLELLLRAPEDSTYEGKTKFKPNETLDLLYMSILQEAFGDDNPEEDPNIRLVLSAVILTVNPLSPSAIATLLGFDTEDVSLVLLSFHSLLILQEGVDHPVQPFHKSFPDFIIDPARCLNQRFLVSPPDYHMELLVGCLELMNKKLEKNMCKLPDAVANSEVNDLQERTSEYIDCGLQYASISWHKHLVGAGPVHTHKITPILHKFLEEKFLFWLEVLSVLGAAKAAVDALQVAANWLNASPTLDLINDYFQFVTGFFEVINTSAPHIYHSALTLSPKTSIVCKVYGQYTHPFARVIQGVPNSWRPIVVATENWGVIGPAAWSPCSRFIAVERGFGTIGVLDAVTLRQLHTFISPTDGDCWLSFPPSGHLLVQLSNKWELTSWDLQTGCPLGTISPEQDTPGKEYSFTYSMDGKVVAAAHWEPHIASTIISTFNLLTQTHTSCHHVTEGHFVLPIWTHGSCFQFVTIKPGSITIWEAEFASTHTPVEVKSLPTPNNIGHSRETLFHPTLSRLAFTLPGAVLVWDAQSSRFLLNFNGSDYPRDMTFSLDGHFFACGSASCIYLWKETSTGYTLHQTITSPTSSLAYRPLLSPNGKSMIVANSSTVQLWHITDPVTSLSSVPTQPAELTDFILGFSPSRTLAAVVRLEENDVTVLDLRSGDQHSIINTGTNVLALRVTGSTLVVVGEGEVITWNLPVENHTINSRVNIGDSLQTTIFNYLPPPGSPLVPYTAISPDLNYIATVWNPQDAHLFIYSVSTGECLIGTATPDQGYIPWFSPDGGEVWCKIYGKQGRGWSIVKDSTSSLTKLEPLGRSAHPSGGLPWQSSSGYKVTSNGWVLSPSRKRLLWLPNHWRMENTYRVWGGQFLGLLRRELPEAVILELDE